MKRMSSSDSLAALIPSCPSAEDKGSAGKKNAYVREFQSMLDSFEDDDSIEESCPVTEKKRRLSVEQVKALEKNFEVENKLEPDRKVRLAQELGLQPRQVAVWFQNRRARWKTKQLEKDYSALKADYEALKLNCDALRRENDALLAQIKELKSKAGQKSIKSSCHVKEEIIQSDADVKISEQRKIENDVEPNQDQCKDGIFTFGDLKDGSSDSDSSVILNDDNGAYGAISPEFLPQEPPHISSILRFDCTFSSSHPSSSINYLHFPDYSRGVSANTQKLDLQIMRNEEHNFLNGGDETCNFFEEEQAPNLSWYCTEPWN